MSKSERKSTDNIFTPSFELPSSQTRISKANHTTAISGKNRENLKLISNLEFV
jgi:hypothetical protein